VDRSLGRHFRDLPFAAVVGFEKEKDVGSRTKASIS